MESKIKKIDLNFEKSVLETYESTLEIHFKKQNFRPIPALNLMCQNKPNGIKNQKNRHKF